MKIRAIVLSLLLVAGSAAAARAEASLEEAQRLTSLFQSYLGRTPGVVTVTPSGDAYAARVDLVPLFESFRIPGASLSLSPLRLTITPRESGTWAFDQDQPLSLALKMAGAGGVTLRIGAMKSAGLFDEALGGFASSETEMTGVSVEQVIVESGQTTHTAYDMETVSYRSRMGGTGDSVNGTVSYGYTGLRQSVAVSGGAAAAEASYTLASPEGMQTASISGLKMRALGELIGWFMAHTSAEAVIAGEQELRQKLRAALPLFRTITSSTEMSRVSITSALGHITLARLGSDTEMNGLVADGLIRQGISLSGLELPSALLPPWAQELAPKALALDVSLTGFDLATPAMMIVDGMNLSAGQPLPPGFEMQLLAALLPKGTVEVALNSSEVASSLFRMTGEGSLKLGPLVPPQGQALVRMRGLDELMSALQAAPPEAGLQDLSAAFLMIKGLARHEEGGSSAWTITARPDGSVMVNGTDVTRMLGGQQ